MKRQLVYEYPPFSPAIAILFFGYVLAFFLQIGFRIDFFGAIRLEFLLAAALLFVTMFLRVPINYPKESLTGFVVFFLFCVTIQVPFSADFDLSSSIYIDRVLKFLVMAVFIAKFVNSPAMIYVFLAAFLLSCFKMGQEGFVGKLSGDLVWQNQGVMRLHGSTPMYRHPNSFAGMALGTLPFIYYLLPLASTKYIKLFFIVMLVFAINIIIFTGSRTAYMASLGMGFIVFRKSSHKKTFFVASVICLVVAFFTVPDQYIERFQSGFTGQDQEGASTAARIQIIKDAFQVFLWHPFGVGVAAFPVVRMEYFDRVQDTHNLYLEVATNLGIQGLLAFILLICVIFSNYKRLRAKIVLQLNRLEGVVFSLQYDELANGVVLHKKHLLLYRGLCDALVTYLIVRLLLGFFGMDMYEIYWWVVIGFVYALAKLNFVAEGKTEMYIDQFNNCMAGLPKKTV